MRIRAQLALLVAPPVAVACVVASSALTTSWEQAGEADRAARLSALAGRSGGLVEALAREQAAAAAVLTGRSGAADGYSRACAETDRSVRRFVSVRGKVGPGRLLASADAGVAGLARLREQVGSGRVALSAVAVQYRILGSDLVAFRESVALADGVPPGVADRLSAAAALSRARAALAHEEMVVLRAGGGVLTARATEEIGQARAAYETALDQFGLSAPAQWRSWLALALSDPLTVSARRLEDEVARQPAGGRLRVEPAEWTEAMAGRQRALRQAEERVDAAVASEIADVESGRWRRAGWLAGLIVLLITGTAASGLWLARRLHQRIRAVRDGAVSFRARLPGMLRDIAEIAPGRTVEEFTARAVPRAARAGRDEITELAREQELLQRAVLAEAWRVAEGQAAQRNGLLRIADHVRTLAGRSAELLDTLQNRDLDPETTELAVRLDHRMNQATRFGAKLEVLAGGQPRRVHPPTTFLDVVRGALGRISRFDRMQGIDVAGVPSGVHVAGTAVDALVLVVCELLDNATVFSAGRVLVAGRVTGDGAELYVADEGIGLPPGKDLNAWITAPDVTSPAAINQLGLTTVGLLAKRLGMTVRIGGHSDPAQRGTVACVRIPARLLVSDVPEPLAPRPASAVLATAPVGAAPHRRGRHAAPEQEPLPQRPHVSAPPAQAFPERSGLPQRVPRESGHTPGPPPREAGAPDVTRRARAANDFARARRAERCRTKEDPV